MTAGVAGTLTALQLRVDSRKHLSRILIPSETEEAEDICAGQEQRWHSEKIDNDATLLSGRDIRKGPCMHQAAPLGAWTAERPVGGLAEGEKAS